MSNVRTVPLGTRLPLEVHSQLVALAESQNQPKTRLMAIAIQAFLDRNATNGKALAV
jgi:predicted transcriptional regulator